MDADFTTDMGDEFVERRRPQPVNINVIVALGGLTLAFLAQFGGMVWIGASMSTNVQNIKDSLIRMDAERYTKYDAARDIQRLDQRSTELGERIRRLEDGSSQTGRGGFVR